MFDVADRWGALHTPQDAERLSPPGRRPQTDASILLMGRCDFILSLFLCAVGLAPTRWHVEVLIHPHLNTFGKTTTSITGQAVACLSYEPLSI
jgi:hypothetical protein